jgi:hypothetical protein
MRSISRVETVSFGGVFWANAVVQIAINKQKRTAGRFMVKSSFGGFSVYVISVRVRKQKETTGLRKLHKNLAEIQAKFLRKKGRPAASHP